MKIWRFYKTPKDAKVHIDENDMKQKVLKLLKE